MSHLPVGAWYQTWNEILHAVFWFPFTSWKSTFPILCWEMWWCTDMWWLADWQHGGLAKANWGLAVKPGLEQRCCACSFVSIILDGSPEKPRARDLRQTLWQIFWRVERRRQERWTEAELQQCHKSTWKHRPNYYYLDITAHTTGLSFSLPNTT